MAINNRQPLASLDLRPGKRKLAVGYPRAIMRHSQGSGAELRRSTLNEHATRR